MRPYGSETEGENETYIMMHQEIFFFYEVDAKVKSEMHKMVHEKTSYHRLDEWNNNRLAYQLKHSSSSSKPY